MRRKFGNFGHSWTIENDPKRLLSAINPRKLCKTLQLKALQHDSLYYKNQTVLMGSSSPVCRRHPALLGGGSEDYS